MTTNKPQVLLMDGGALTNTWPFTRGRLEQRLEGIAEVTHLDVADRDLSDFDWTTVNAVALFGGELTESILDRASQLSVVGGITDAQGPSCFELLCKRNIPFVDATAAWGQSVAECGFALVLCALRKLPQWHARLADRSFDWKFPYGQFCDDPAFVNGELATKTVGIIGLGQIGMRLARWCDAFGATVLAYDPFAPAERFADAGAAKRDVDTLISEVDILIIAVPPTPSAANLVSSERIMRLAQGTIVMTITRTHAVDVSTLRKRVLANELFWASDVYDIEPLPNDDPILGRGNVMHVPHIAGRTRDANLRLADIIADDFIRVFNGHTPQYALKPNAVSIRTEKAPKLTEAANKTDAGDA